MIENMPQFVIQVLYVREELMDHGIGEITPVLFISMIFSILAILMSSVYQVARACQLCQPKNTEFKYETSIDSCITLKSSHLKKHHAFADRRCEECIIDSLHTFDNARTYFGRADIMIENEVYYIDSRINTVCELDIYSQLTIFSNDSKIGKLFYSNFQSMTNTWNHSYQIFRNALIKSLNLNQIPVTNIDTNTIDAIATATGNSDINTSTNTNNDTNNDDDDLTIKLINLSMSKQDLNTNTNKTTKGGGKEEFQIDIFASSDQSHSHSKSNSNSRSRVLSNPQPRALPVSPSSPVGSGSPDNFINYNYESRRAAGHGRGIGQLSQHNSNSNPETNLAITLPPLPSLSNEITDGSCKSRSARIVYLSDVMSSDKEDSVKM